MPSALVLNCTLKASPSPSSTDMLLGLLTDALRRHGVESGPPVRVVDHDVKPGVTADEGEGDAWPALREQLLAADVLVFGTPVWLGAPSSVAKRVVERLDAMLSETDDRNRMPTFGKVAVLAVVGNEDGAHHSSAELYQWLNDVGFSLAPSAVAYWVGEAMHGTDFNDLDEVPEEVTAAVEGAASAAAHLASLLAATPYPGYGG